MKHAIKMYVIFAFIEMAQSITVAYFVYIRVWYVAAFSAATLMGMLTVHIISGVNMAAAWIIDEANKRDVRHGPSS